MADEQLRAIFSRIDTDGDGRIDAQELLPILQGLRPGATLQEAQSLIREVDPDESGDIDEDEFLAAMRLRHERAPSAEKMFELIDTSHAGGLGPSAIRAALERFGMAGTSGQDLWDDVDEMIRAVDEDGDGLVGIEEFVKAFPSAIPQPALRELSGSRSAALTGRSGYSAGYSGRTTSG